MRWRTFTFGCSLALLLLLLTQYRPADTSPSTPTAVVEFSYAAGQTHKFHTASTRKTQRVVAPLVVLDISSKIATDPHYLVTVDDVARWEERHGHIPLDAVVLARSDIAGRWRPDQRSTEAGRFPGYSADAVRFLVEARSVYGLGTDTPEGGRSLVLPYRSAAK